MRALLTGGASCGKSAVAEDLCMGLGGSLVYLAAMRPFGEEGAARVRKHRAQRAGKGFQTVECYEDFKLVLEDGRIDDGADRGPVSPRSKRCWAIYVNLRFIHSLRNGLKILYSPS